MKAILVNYNFIPSWLLESDLDWYLYDRSDSKDYLKDFPQERIRYTPNIGNVDYDKLAYLLDFYDNLPEFFLWGKSNLFKYITEEEWAVYKQHTDFTPLVGLTHKTYADKFGPVCYYHDGMYFERNDVWYLTQHPAKYVNDWNDWAREFFLPTPRYIPFPPGGNFILTKERVHRYAKDYYARMRDTLDWAQTPGEAQLCERTYYLLWS